MKLNLMYRSTANLMVTMGLPIGTVLLVVFGIQATSLVSQLLLSLAGVGVVFSALLLLPYFIEQHSRMQAVYNRYDAIQAASRIRAQRSQYYTLNRALLRHQLRGRAQWVLATN